jgi:hypothetical protein
MFANLGTAPYNVAGEGETGGMMKRRQSILNHWCADPSGRAAQRVV